ncbi:hypothetical protein N5079_20655 [Planotetraspora sp. A-T 1434]|uniref:hypothetical protein n=1 Tax=Planotetraspora sp. A-T 1434 TaxID=2979219 RepID=UPI0021C19900|nr:hypothetical protein [Planotetraspora sp. A-T 1434]MCT9932616.1 hypothetical protein [Planotetraspora sp. A-T 1434]
MRMILERWARRGRSSQVLAMRSKIVLTRAAGGDNIETAARLPVHHDSVSKWGTRFVRLRPEGLTDEQPVE